MWTQLTPFIGIAMAAVGAVGAVYAFSKGRCTWSVLLIAVVLLGAARTAAFQTPGPRDVSNLAESHYPVVLEGTIASDPAIRPNWVRLVLRVQNSLISGRDVPVSGLISIVVRRSAVSRLESEFQALEYGQMLRVSGYVARPHSSHRPGEFSYEEYLKRQGIFSTMSIDTPSSLKLLTSRSGAAWIRWSFDARKAACRLISRHLPSDEAGLVSGMLFGNYTLVPEKLVNSFTRSGTLHLLAASGFNCTLIVLIFWRALLKPAKAPRRLAVGLVIGMVFFYVLMVGCSPSIVRAGVGAALFLGALLVGRPANMVNTLFATALIMLIVNPLSIADVGFQLSFAAVGSIVAFVPRLETLLELGHSKVEDRPKPHSLSALWHVPLRHVLKVLIVTLAATAATSPILAQHFNRVSIVSLPANTAVAFLAECLFVVSVGLVLFFWIPFVGDFLASITYVLAAGVERVVNAAGAPVWAQVEVSSPGPFGLLSFFIALAGVWIAVDRATRPQIVRLAKVQDPFQ